MTNWQLLKNDLIAYTQECAPEEACGLIAAGQFWPCKNIHSDPLSSFAIDAASYARVDELNTGVEAVFHSHPRADNKFSMNDIKACKELGVPWVMYCAAFNQWHYMDPINAPYLQRPWIYGIYDCYGLVKDYYKNEFDIELDDYERGCEFEWESSEWRMFEKNFSSQGFEEISSNLNKGDILLMQLQSNFPNHVGIIHDSKRGIFYQHLFDRLSEANIYGGYWQKHTNKILRHRSLM